MKRINNVDTFFLGKTLKELSPEGFLLTTGEKFVFEHQQDCCENVRLIATDGVGDMTDLPIKEFSCRGEEYPGYDYKNSSYTWSTYTIIVKGGAFRKFYFLGESNGWYGETTDVYQVD